METYNQLSEHLKEGSLVAFLGAGVSRSYEDPTSGQTFPGIMTANEIVHDFARKRGYITTDMGFLEACFLYKQQEGRVGLERYLQECIDRPAIKPLPAHVILANTPFASYVTTNFDRLMEGALQDAKKSPFPIIEDDDVSRLRHSCVPVIKIHGCVTRPGTMLACEDEYVPLDERSAIIEALLKTQIANKTILFLGYSLEDSDFKLVYEEVKRTLGDRMPRSFAVVHSATAYQDVLWKKRGVTIIQRDLTQFLRGLLHACVEVRRTTIYDREQDWVHNQFFESLLRIRTSPSETQAIDAFLDHLMKEVRSPAFALDDILDRAKRASALVLQQKKNFEAFRKASDSVISKIETNCACREDAEVVLREILDERATQTSALRRKWDLAVARNNNLLTFSQSVRVAELLKGVPRGIQDTCQIFIAECRPKSPVSFQDALAVADSLRNTGYTLTLIPDACIGHLISRNQIDKILVGAHAIHMFEGKPVWFVNTSGTSQLLDSATRYDIPVYVVAESSKIVTMTDVDESPNVSFEEEEDVFEDVMPSVSDLKAGGMLVSTLNIGYDLCRFSTGVLLLTEDGICGE